ncbi:hypothetical protein G7Y89_g10106 [Cudoniella acicularis]|uniref:Uncharacterized protein n=1 Tax=Cudoniella acicularis TaxID=354080 RepID=A0A8H4VZD5_9HELO|nr:hypothetical protein G7Y89_g10106 [Cudoniella acicularis]
MLPDIRDKRVWRNDFCHDPILRYIQLDNPESVNIEDYKLPLHAEPEHSTSINYHWKIGRMRAAKLKLDCNPRKEPLSGENRPWLANSKGFPIAQVLLDGDIQVDKTVVDYLIQSDHNVYCMQTVLKNSQEHSGATNGETEAIKDIAVSVSINGLVLIPFAWAKRIAFRRIGVFVDRTPGYDNDPLSFGTMTLI